MAGSGSITWIVLPHQLFDVRRVWMPLWRKHRVSHVVVLEDECFWGQRKGAAAGRRATLPLNPLRLAYQRLLLDAFIAELGAIKTVRVTKASALSELSRHSDTAEWWICDPVDTLFEQKLAKWEGTVHIVDTPMFVASRDHLEAYMQRVSSSGSRLQHRAFFEWMKRRHPQLHRLDGVSSTDADNRRPWRAGRDPAPPPWAPTVAKHRRYDTAKSALEWALHLPAATHAPRPSPDLVANWTQTLTQLPLRPPAARTWLARFLRERLPYFGTYQDAIVSGEPNMFHSGISPFLNFGLLLPEEVLVAATAAARAPSVPMNAYEAFVRQVLGWREYTRLYYRVVPRSVWHKNALQARRRLSAEWWALPASAPAAPAAPSAPAGSLPPIVTEAIADAWRYGYLHHIRRLMVVANWMTLSGIHPDDMFDWFSAFALDAHEWVMVFNVYAMGSFADGGHASRKPYVSSAAYLLRMSDAPNGPWADAWRDKYATFCARVKRCGR